MPRASPNPWLQMFAISAILAMVGIQAWVGFRAPIEVYVIVGALGGATTVVDLYRPKE